MSAHSVGAIPRREPSSSLVAQGRKTHLIIYAKDEKRNANKKSHRRNRCRICLPCSRVGPPTTSRTPHPFWVRVSRASTLSFLHNWIQTHFLKRCKTVYHLCVYFIRCLSLWRSISRSQRKKIPMSLSVFETQFRIESIGIPGTFRFWFFESKLRIAVEREVYSSRV